MDKLEIWGDERLLKDDGRRCIGYGGEDGAYVGTIANKEQAKLIVESVNNAQRYKEALETIVAIDDYGNANPQAMGLIAYSALKED